MGDGLELQESCPFNLVRALRVEGGFRLHYLPISRSGIFRFVHVHVFLLDFPNSVDSDRQLELGTSIDRSTAVAGCHPDSRVLRASFFPLLNASMF